MSDELKDLEIKIAKEYKKASDDLQKKWEDYIKGWDEGSGDNKIHHKSIQERYEEQYKVYQEGKYTKQQFDDWYQAQIGRGDRWQDLRKQMAQRMTDAKKIATSYINDTLPTAYTKSFNDFLDIERASNMKIGQMGIRFDLIDEDVVRNLMLDQRNVTEYRVDFKLHTITGDQTGRRIDLRPLAIDPIKDYDWNTKQIQNALLQGIIQGESVGKIADRFMDVMHRNRNSAIRNARTAVTGARNRGKLDRWGNLTDQGCDITKKWISLGDDRVRDAHADADGQEVPYKEPFIVGGEEMDCPCDPNGSPANVYNCRCSMQTGSIKFKSILSKSQRDKAGIRVRGSEDQGGTKSPIFKQQSTENSFIPAKTKAEAEKYAKKFANSVDYKGISLQNANIINQTLTDLTSKYPINKLATISNQGGRAVASANYQRLRINGSKLGSNGMSDFLKSQQADRDNIAFMKSRFVGKKMPPAVEDSIKKLENSLRFKRWGVSDSYIGQEARAVVTHEYGHIIADQYFGQINKEFANKNRGEFFSKATNQSNVWDLIYSRAKNNDDLYSLSQYGSKNSHEFLAECFVAREMGEKLPDYINKALEDILKNGIL